MTLREAMKRGLTAVRKDHWLFEDDRVELDRVGTGADGQPLYGPWGKLVSPASKSLRRQETPILLVGDRAEDWVEYLAHSE